MNRRPWPLVLLAALFAVLVVAALVGCAPPPDDGVRVCLECVVTITAPAWGP